MARSKDELYKLFDYDVDLSKRVISIGGNNDSEDNEESGIDANTASRVIKSLYLMGIDDPNGDKPITILLNSIGGDDFHMFAIYDAIKASKSHVKIVVSGQAMSAGSVILQAADERVLSPHSRVLIHYGTWESPNDHPTTVQRWAEESKKVNTDMENIYLAAIREKHPDYTLKSLQKLLNFDTIFSAQEAIELGLADKILT